MIHRHIGRHRSLLGLKSLLAVMSCCVMFSAGCLSRQVARDGVGLRNAMIDLYTDQAIDNLIRARNRQLFVQMKYSQLSVDDSSALSGAASSAAGSFTTSFQQATRAVTAAGVFPLSASASKTRKVSFQADPVTDQNYVYEEYMAFADNPMLLIACNKKPTCSFVVSRQCGSLWYYIPPEAGSAFLQLVIDVSVGLDSQPAEAWTATIKTATPVYDQNGVPDPTHRHFVLTLDTPVPNDEGQILASLASPSSRKVALHAYPEHLTSYQTRSSKPRK